MKKNNSIIAAVIFYSLAAIFIFIAFHKLLVYSNPQDSFAALKGPAANAYVGADAYNYIINGTYFTGYSVLGVGSAIIGTMFLLNRSESNETDQI